MRGRCRSFSAPRRGINPTGTRPLNAKGAEIKISGTFYTGVTPMAVYRLLPGEYCEVGGHGIAIGAGKYEEEFSIGSVGAIIEAKEGDEVSLSHTVDAAQGIKFSRPDDPKDPAELWKRQVAEPHAQDRIKRITMPPEGCADQLRAVGSVTDNHILIREYFGPATRQASQRRLARHGTGQRRRSRCHATPGRRRVATTRDTGAAAFACRYGS